MDGLITLTKEQYDKLYNSILALGEKLNRATRYETLLEVLNKAKKYNNGYETDFSNFISDLEIEILTQPKQ